MVIMCPFRKEDKIAFQCELTDLKMSTALKQKIWTLAKNGKPHATMRIILHKNGKEGGNLVRLSS